MFVRSWVESRMTDGESFTLSQNPANALITFGGTPTLSGATISESTAEGIPGVYACVNFRARMVGQVPLVLYRRRPDDGRDRATDQDLYYLLHDLPNPEMTASVFKTVLERWKWLWGNAYAEIQRDDRGRPIALWPLRSDRMVVDRDERRRLRYMYTLDDGSSKVWIFDPERPPVLHLRINALDGIHGRTPIRILREAHGLAKALEEHGSRFFGNRSVPGGFIKGPQGVKLSPEAARRIREDWERLHRGPDQAHRVAVLEQGFEFENISLPNDDAQFIESRKFQLQELARIYSLPPHVIQDLERSTNNNIEHQGLELVSLHLMPDFVDWEEAISRDLLTSRGFMLYYAQFNVDSLLRADATTRAEVLEKRRQNGIINANEWRKLDDLNPIPAEAGGDAYLVNGNMIPITQALSRPRPPVEQVA